MKLLLKAGNHWSFLMAFDDVFYQHRGFVRGFLTVKSIPPYAGRPRLSQDE